MGLGGQLPTHAGPMIDAPGALRDELGVPDEPGGGGGAQPSSSHDADTLPQAWCALALLGVGLLAEHRTPRAAPHAAVLTTRRR